MIATSLQTPKRRAIRKASGISALIVIALVYGGAAAYSWHFYSNASIWWAGAGLGTPGAARR
jgi:hypothetical protein